MQEMLSAHEVRLINVGNSIVVSCKCRLQTGKHSKAGKLVYSHIGETKNFDETIELYNNPDNHWAPFEKKDEIGGKRKR